MPIELKMPALSPTMEEGTLAKWLVKEGDKVASGDILAEIETDKATMEFEAVDEGTIAKIIVPEGTDGVKVGAPIAILAGEGEDASSAASAAPKPDTAGNAARPGCSGRPEARRHANANPTGKGLRRSPRQDPAQAAPAPAQSATSDRATASRPPPRPPPGAGPGHRPRQPEGQRPQRPDRSRRCRCRGGQGAGRSIRRSCCPARGRGCTRASPAISRTRS